MRRLGVPVVIGVALFAGWSTDARAQRPVAVAEMRFDVNGDGRIDVIRIEDPAAVAIGFTGGKPGAQWKPFKATGRKIIGGTITVGAGKRYGGRTVIVATAHFGSRGRVTSREAMALAWHKGALAEIWRGAVGPQGRDGEWSLHIEASNRGLIKYQRRPGLERCDGQTPYLFPEGYDWRAKKFRPVTNPVRVDDNAPHLTATRRTPAGASDTSQPMVFRRLTASTQEGAQNGADLVSVRELFDGNPKTAWREDIGGHGKGEFVTARATTRTADVAAIRIIGGDARSAEAFATSNRLKAIALLIGTQAYRVEFPVDAARDKSAAFDKPFWIALPKTIPATCVSVIISDVYPNNGKGQTAISELSVFTAMEMKAGGAYKTLVKRIAAGGKGTESAMLTLARGGAKAAEAVMAEMTLLGENPSPDAAAMLRLYRSLAMIAEPASAPDLVKALLLPGLSDDDMWLFQKTLMKIGTRAITPLAALLTDKKAPASPRRAAAQVLSRLRDDAAFLALIGAAGKGPRSVRRSVSRALDRSIRWLHKDDGQTRILESIQRAEATGDSGLEADLWRALAMTEATEATRAALVKRLGTAEGYELRYRLFSGARGMATDAVLDALAAALKRTGADAEGTALRRVAVTALSQKHLPKAIAILIASTEDRDPGVRRRAVAALGTIISADGAIAPAVAKRLAGDHWPHVRRAAATALRDRCGHPEPAKALYSAVAKDKEISVRTTALTSLVRCRAGGIGSRLVAIAGDRNQATDLRVRAAKLIGVLGDRSLASKLVRLFKAHRNEAMSGTGAASLELAATSAGALGLLGGSAAVAALLSAAKDSSFPEIQAAALTALGKLCPRAAAPVFDRQALSSQRMVAIAAKGARSRCREGSRR